MNHSALRIVFAGTPNFAAEHLNALIEQNYNVLAAYSQPDRPAGRGKKLKASPVKSLALEHDIPVYQPLSLNTSEQQALLKSLNADVMIVVAYGLLLPQAILEIPVHGCLNVHASLLPRWRGAAPIERAILAGDHETGVSIMQMDAGLDTGDTLLKLSTPLNLSDNSEALTSRLLDLGCQGLVEVLSQIDNNSLNPVQQDNVLSNYAHKLSKAEALINWHQPALEIQRQINAFFPRSPAYCFFNNVRVKIIQSQLGGKLKNQHQIEPGTIIETSKTGLLVSCLDSSLLVTHIQLAGKKPNSVADILNGQPSFFKPGSCFKSMEVPNEI